MRRTRMRQVDSEINVTPLLDVVFIMLIFFIVTASFIKPTAIDVGTQSGASVAQGSGGLFVGAHESGDVEPGAEGARPPREHDGTGIGFGLVERDVEIGDRIQRDGVLLAVIHGDEGDAVLDVE